MMMSKLQIQSIVAESNERVANDMLGKVSEAFAKNDRATVKLHAAILHREAEITGSAAIKSIANEADIILAQMDSR